jgi:CDP-diacylglycerol--serine O-phosphatidyltransferase
MKQLPNIFTLLNLVFGCLAIAAILQPGLVLVYSENNNQWLPAVNSETGVQLISVPEKIYLGSVFIGCAAVIDFLDGFVARFLKATSEIGKQLDSLADVVSFGVAPGFIVYEFLRLSYAQQENGLDINLLWILPAFIIPCAGAYRLARFNMDTEQSHGFKGVPIPAAGLLIASFPLIYWYSSNTFSVQLLLNEWFWYAVIFIISWLMISTLPMMALKFKNVSLKNFLAFIIIVIVAAISAFIVGWVSVPITFIAYVFLSLLYKTKKTT